MGISPLRMKHILSVRFSRHAETYSKWAVPQKVAAKVLVDFIEPAGSVLDVGCGTGFISGFLNGCCRLVSVDISPGMAKVVKKSNGTVVIGDAEALPFRDRSFDYVLSSFSLHWTDLEKSIGEMKRIARDGVGISIPVKGSLEEFGFPFPSECDVLNMFPPDRITYKVMSIKIPFTGMDLLKYFHFTGTSYNPLNTNMFSRSRLLDMIGKVKDSSFRVLFLYARLG